MGQGKMDLTHFGPSTGICRASKLGVDGFITKPGDPNKLLAILKTIQNYWLKEARPLGTFIAFAAAENVTVLSPRNSSLP